MRIFYNFKGRYYILSLRSDQKLYLLKFRYITCSHMPKSPSIVLLRSIKLQELLGILGALYIRSCFYCYFEFLNAFGMIVVEYI
jgi:hypothetical protein